MATRDERDRTTPEARLSRKERIAARRRAEAERDKASLSTTIMVVVFIVAIVGFAIWLTS
jgi:hypothetical protein